MIIHSQSLPYYDNDNTVIIFDSWTGTKYKIDKTFFKDLTIEGGRFLQYYTYSIDKKGILAVYPNN